MFDRKHFVLIIPSILKVSAWEKSREWKPGNFVPCIRLLLARKTGIFLYEKGFSNYKQITLLIFGLDFFHRSKTFNLQKLTRKKLVILFFSLEFWKHGFLAVLFFFSSQKSDTTFSVNTKSSLLSRRCDSFLIDFGGGSEENAFCSYPRARLLLL